MLDTIVLQVFPPSVDLSILYPDMVALPPGAVQLRFIWLDDTAVAVRPVGELGNVYPVTFEEYVPSPILFHAAIRNL